MAKNTKGGLTIIKREEVVEGAHHGGAWKVAYADFMTAMMAFFLLMWLLNATTEAQRKGLADYFAPTNVLGRGLSGNGQPFGGHTPFDEGSMASDRGAVAVLQGKQVVPSDVDPDDNAETPAQSRTYQREPTATDAMGNSVRMPGGNTAAGTAGTTPRSTRPPGSGPADRITPEGGPASPAVGPNGVPGASEPANIAGAAFQGGLTAGALRQGGATQATGVQSAAAQAAQAAEAAEAVQAAAQERQQFAAAADQIKEAVRRDPALAELAHQLAIDVTPEGLRIQLLDEAHQSMFPSGSTTLNERARLLLQKIVPVLNRLSEDISVAGYTDSAPYPGADRTNWELSTERANATRHLLTEAGLADDRIKSVTGHADRDPLLPQQPLAAANRRIAIVVLRHIPLATPAATPAPALAR